MRPHGTRWAALLLVLGALGRPGCAGDRNHTVAPPNAVVNWRMGLGRGRKVAEPVLWEDEGVVFGYASGSDGSLLVAVNATSGEQILSHRVTETGTTEPPEAPVLYPGGTDGDGRVGAGNCLIYVVAPDHTLRAYNFSNVSEPVFTYAFDAAPSQPLLLGGGTDPFRLAGGESGAYLYLTTVNDSKCLVHKIDALTGAVRWQITLYIPYPATPARASAPALISQRMWVLTTSKLWSLSPITGLVYGRGVPLSGAPVNRAPPLRGAAYYHVIVTLATGGGYIDPWQFAAATAAPERNATRVYAVDRYGGIYWGHDIGVSHGRVQVPPVVYNDSQLVFAADTCGSPSPVSKAELLALSMSGNRAWMSPPVAAAGAERAAAVYSNPVLSSDGALMLAGVANGSLSLWSLMSAGGDNAAWQELRVGSVDAAADDAAGAAAAPLFVVSGAVTMLAATASSIYSVSLGQPAPAPPVPLAPRAHTIVGYLAGAAGALLFCGFALLPKMYGMRQRAARERAAADEAGAPSPVGLDLSSPCDEFVGEGWTEATQSRGRRQPKHRYRIMRKLGSGAFGTVYKVRCLADGRFYAMKKLPCDSDAEQRQALAEWMHLCSIQHPNKVEGFTAFYSHPFDSYEGGGGAKAAGRRRRTQKDGACDNNDEDGEGTSLFADPVLQDDARFMFLVMRYHPLGDLRMYVRSLPRHASVEEARILRYSAQVASLLQTLHNQNPPISHRDLKPENILLTDNGQDVVVTDFGLAKGVAPGEYLNTHAGTYAYISPETWGQRYGVEVDIWALGCIMYAMVSKRVDKQHARCLWQEAAHASFQRSLLEEVTHHYRYSEFLAGVITTLLTPDRHQRPTADEAMRRFFAPHASLALPAAPPPPPPPPPPLQPAPSSPLAVPRDRRPSDCAAG